MADQAEDMETATTANEEPMDTSNSEVQAQVQTSQNENSETGGNDNPSSIETENMETVTKDDSSNVLPSEDKTGQDTPMDENTSKSEEADALKEGESSKEEPETTKEDSSNESSQPEPRKDDFFSKLIGKVCEHFLKIRYSKYMKGRIKDVSRISKPVGLYFHEF